SMRALSGSSGAGGPRTASRASSTTRTGWRNKFTKGSLACWPCFRPRCRYREEKTMSSLPRLARLGALALAAVTLAACSAAVRVNSYSERGVDFRHYRTYTFGPPETMSTGDPRLDNNPFFLERVQAAVEKQLATR